MLKPPPRKTRLSPLIAMALAATLQGPAAAQAAIPRNAADYTALVLRTWRHITDLENTIAYCARHVPKSAEFFKDNLSSWKLIYEDQQARVDRHMVAWAQREAKRSGRNGRDIAIALDERAKQDNADVLDPLRLRDLAALASQCVILAESLGTPEYDLSLTHASELAAMARCRMWKWCDAQQGFHP
jgi:hypothetical protein